MSKATFTDSIAEGTAGLPEVHSVARAKAICSVCGVVEYVELEPGGQVPIGIEPPDGWRVHNYRVRLTGICPQCKKVRN